MVGAIGKFALPREIFYLALVNRGVMKSSAKRIKCPTCKKRGAWFSGAFGPFCSHRCKLIDLGKWLGEEHRISEPLPPDQQPTSGSQLPADGSDSSETDKDI